MLEKIGLPAKPSMRGANWVIDASHCQGCSSPFTFFNRKHHCRRCGGIFCNTCTQQRMVLRGQGDSPVRICDPCKKLEEAARFELRYGHKNKAAKGSSKQIPDAEDELSEILHTDSKHSMSFANASHSLSDLSDTGNSVVHANLPTVLESSNSIDGHIDSPTGVTCSPEDLRQQVMEEKKKYRLLKAEGKSDEALRAFKHGKELERQAVALEITIRKARRMSGKKVSTISNMVSTDRIDDHGIDKKLASSKGEEVRDDLFTELRQLGWSDTELHDSEKKTGKLSLEGELSSLLGETSQKSGTGRKKGGMDRSQVVAQKRKALLLKREGKLAEAKEELKQAKILEKQLEEQEFLGDASDSEDELYTLINNMDDDDNQEDLMLKNPLDDGKNFDYLLGSTDDLPIDDNLEVTDNDMNDPELSAALKSFGWTEEDEDHGSVREEDLQAKVLKLKKEAFNLKQEGKLPEAMTLLKKVKLLEQDLGNLLSEPHILDLGFTKRTDDNKTSAPKSKIVIQKELLALKRKALTLRREGRVEEADEELKKGKILEQQLEVLENPLKIPSTKWMEPTRDQPIDPGSLYFSVDIAETEATDQDMHDPSMLSALKSLGWNEDESDSLSTTLNASKHSSVPLPCKSTRNKGETQRELLAVKRKALSLRRQGKAEEAEEELMRAKDLERQLADLEQSVPAIKQEKPTIRDAEDNSSKVISIETNKIDDSTKPIVTPSNSESKAPKAAITVSSESDQIVGENSSSFSKETDCYKEDILTHKRTALALKREGKLIEAKEELRKAKLLEKALLEGQGSSIDDKTAAVSTSESTSTMLESKTHVQKPKSSRDRFKLQQESLAHKRNALKLRREGKIQEADAELEKAKELESQLEEVGAPGPSNSTSHGVLDAGIVEDFLDPQLMSALKSIGWDDKDLLTKPTEKMESQSSTKNVSSNQSHIDGTHLEGQIKAIKIRALNLKRAGKQDEALDALREAKKLEKKLNLSN